VTAPRDIRLYVDDMIAATAELAAIAADGEPAFKASLRTRLAAERLIEILGEAASQIPADFREQHTGVPWRALAATRNRIIHGYHSVDADRVWALVTTSTTELQTQLKAVLNALNKAS